MGISFQRRKPYVDYLAKLDECQQIETSTIFWAPTFPSFSLIQFSSAIGGKLVTNNVDPVPTRTSIGLPSSIFISFVCAVRTSSFESNSIFAVADSLSASWRSFKSLIGPHYPRLDVSIFEEEDGQLTSLKYCRMRVSVISKGKFFTITVAFSRSRLIFEGVKEVLAAGIGSAV